MNNRVKEIIALLEEVLTLSPGQKKSLPKKLLTFLKVRQLPDFQDIQKRFESVIPRLADDPKSQPLKQLLIKESKILSLFIGLNSEEVKELESYLKNLTSLREDSLALFLFKKSGGKIGNRWNPDDFKDAATKSFAICRAVEASDDEEDFQIELTSSIPNDTLLEWLSDFYAAKGYKPVTHMKECFLAAMFQKENEYLFVNTTQWELLLQVTVMRDIFNKKA